MKLLAAFLIALVLGSAWVSAHHSLDELGPRLTITGTR